MTQEHIAHLAWKTASNGTKAKLENAFIQFIHAEDAPPLADDGFRNDTPRKTICTAVFRKEISDAAWGAGTLGYAVSMASSNPTGTTAFTM